MSVTNSNSTFFHRIYLSVSWYFPKATINSLGSIHIYNGDCVILMREKLIFYIYLLFILTLNIHMCMCVYIYVYYI